MSLGGKNEKNAFSGLLFRFSVLQYNAYLPVAQLDSASDSDSEGRRFESCRVGQNNGIAPTGGYPIILSSTPYIRTVSSPLGGHNKKGAKKLQTSFLAPLYFYGASAGEAKPGKRNGPGAHSPQFDGQFGGQRSFISKSKAQTGRRAGLVYL